MSGREDRYSRSSRDERGDRYGNSSGSSGAHGGRYASHTQRRSGDGDDGRGDADDRRRHRRYREASRGRDHRRRDRRSRSVDSSVSSHTREDGGRARKVSRFQPTDTESLLHAHQQQQAYYGAIPPAHPPPSSEANFMGYDVGQVPGMPSFDPQYSASMADGGGVGMSAGELLQFLQTRVQGSATAQPPSLPPADELASSAGQPSLRAVASVEDFVPVIPKSLLSLVGGPMPPPLSAAADGPDGPAAGKEAEPPALNAEGGTDGAGAMIVLEAPKIAPEIERLAREARRAHVSGFPVGTTKEDLLQFFRVLLPEVRRVMTQRQMYELAAENGIAESDVSTIAPNARTDLDDIRDLSVSLAKTKAFGFIEVSYADLITEVVAESQKDPERFVFVAPDGRGYPLVIRRPRDYTALDGMDKDKVVMLGFPPSLPHDKLREVFEQFGPLTKFEAVASIACAEFEKEQDALECRCEMHGCVLGNRMLAVLPLHDWLKVVCHQAGLDITVEKTDPISGAWVLQHALSGGADGAGPGADGGGRAGGEGGATAASGGVGGSTALVLAPEKVDHMQELLEMTVSIPDVVFHLTHTYPHLRPLYGNNQVAIYATRVLVLLNLFDEEELTLDDTYSRLLADIEQEVEKHGRVEELVVPRREGRPRPPEVPRRAHYENAEAFDDASAAYETARASFNREVELYMERQLHPVWGGYGRVFVKYETVDEAAEAQQRIAGRLFGGRTVVTSFLFEDIMRKPGEAEEASAAEEEEEEGADAAAESNAGGKERASDAGVPEEVEEFNATEDVD